MELKLTYSFKCSAQIFHSRKPSKTLAISVIYMHGNYAEQFIASRAISPTPAFEFSISKALVLRTENLPLPGEGLVALHVSIPIENNKGMTREGAYIGQDDDENSNPSKCSRDAAKGDNIDILKDLKDENPLDEDLDLSKFNGGQEMNVSLTFYH